MKYEITVNPTTNSNLPKLDFNNIPFGRVFSDHMFIADYRDGEWTDLRIVPFGPFEMHPANMTLHYSQTIFEGMKASKNKDGVPMLLRPELHARRLNASADRMCMPHVPEALFLQALHELIGLDSDWIPTLPGTSLYVRPYMYATDEFIGVKPSDTYKFVIFTCPVGSYYATPVNLVTEQKYVRAVNGLTGEAKAGGNYAASLLPAKLAKEKGYDQVIWMESPDFKKVQEVGTMNLFFVIGDTVVTPSTTGAILKGITRKCFLEICAKRGIKTEERDIYIDEIVEAYEAGQLKEIFGAGTAAVVSHVASLTHNDFKMTLPPVEEREIGNMLKREIAGLRTGEVEDIYGWMVPVETAVTA
ncbi:MAG: branched-chain amino acid aminotransferase [Bacteroidota bacterium]